MINFIITYNIFNHFLLYMSKNSQQYLLYFYNSIFYYSKSKKNLKKRFFLLGLIWMILYSLIRLETSVLFNLYFNIKYK